LGERKVGDLLPYQRPPERQFGKVCHEDINGNDSGGEEWGKA